jgi:hypothetical protein
MALQGELGAVVADDHAWFATPIDDRCQFACNAPCRDRGVGDRTQTFLGDVIDDVQNAEASAIGELIVDKVQRPARIGLGLHQYRRSRANGLAASSASAHGQAFFPIEAMDTIDARWLSFPPQQDEQPSVAKPPALVASSRRRARRSVSGGLRDR